jgi:hypothetical protein
VSGADKKPEPAEPPTVEPDRDILAAELKHGDEDGKPLGR